jgi:hypothetical protein
MPHAPENERDTLINGFLAALRVLGILAEGVEEVRWVEQSAAL